MTNIDASARAISSWQGSNASEHKDFTSKVPIGMDVALNLRNT